MDYTLLVNEAFNASRFSYSPYSRFRVGAALLTADGNIYTGCNIESAAYSATNCAERTAFFKAVSSGELKFKAIAITGSPENGAADYCYPCGVCLQVMSEFCPPDDFTVIVAKDRQNYKEYTLRQLLPFGFSM